MIARRFAPSLLALLLWSCVTPSGPSPFGARVDADASYDRLSRAAARDRADADDLAQAGWLALFRRNDAETAELRWKTSVRKDPSQASAHLGLAEIARARLDDPAAVRAYLALLERAPADPLAEVAIDRLPGVLGSDPAVDAEALEVLTALGRREGIAPRVRLAAREVRAGLLESAGSLERAAEVRAGAGGPSAFTVVGPFSAFRALDAERHFGPESGGLEPSYDTPFGAVQPRVVPAPGGFLSLGAEPGRGDVYYAIADVELPSGGPWLLSWRTDADLRLAIDGVELARRDDLRGYPASEGLTAFTAGPGTHRIVVRLIRGYDAGYLRLRLHDAAGRPAQAAFSAPSAGPAPATAGEVTAAAAPDGLASWVDAALAIDPTDGWAAYVAALHLAGTDPEAAKAHLGTTLAAAPAFAHARHLEAALALRDPALTGELRTGRASRAALEAARGDPAHAAARVLAANLALDQSRFDDAEPLLDEAATLAPASADVARSRARLLGERGLPVLARQVLEEAAERRPGSCPILGALHRARAGDQDVAGADDTAERLKTCGIDGLTTWADLRAQRGDLEAAIDAWQRVASLAPDQVQPALRLSEVLASAGRHEDAIQVLEARRAIWPTQGFLPERMARLRAQAGDRKAALSLHREALRLAPGDLATRSALAFHEGTELLSWGALDLDAEIRTHLDAGAAVPAADAVMIVDHAAIEVVAEDPHRPVILERVQSVIQVLTKKGIDRHGEVAVPDGARVIAIHNRKPDGRKLEPEDLIGKDRISLPGLEAGDHVVVDFVAAHGPRSAALPGWSTNPFFFRVFDLPLLRSSYVVRAPRELGLEVEAHGFEAAPVETQGEHVVFRHVARDVASIHAEPDAVGADEVLPWARVGVGAGPVSYGDLWGDYVFGRARPTVEVRRFAEKIRDEAGTTEPRALALAAAAAVDGEIRGETSSSSFGDLAAQALTRGRGNRLLVLRAVLDVLGLPSRVALVRPFSADPAAYRFPAGDLFTHAVLRVDVGGPEALWIDQNLRTAPLGLLRKVHAGQPALLLAEPGAPAEVVTTPAFANLDERKDAVIRLELDASGGLMADGSEQYVGFSGAMVRGGFESVDDDRRRQAVEAGLSRAFGPIELLELSFEGDEASSPPGTPFTIRYRFRAQTWARRAGDRLVVPGGSLFPANLSRRLIRLAQRETPLLLDTEHAQTLEATVVAPEGLEIVGFDDAAFETPFGRFTQQAKRKGSEVVISERLDLNLARVPPADYAALARFCAGVDSAQSRDLVFAK